MYTFYDQKRIELQQKNSQIKSKLSAIKEVQKPVLNLLNEDSKHQEISTQKIKELPLATSQHYSNLNEHLLEIDQTIKEHYNRVNMFQNNYIMSNVFQNEDNQALQQCKNQHQKLTKKFNNISKQLLQEQQNEGKKYEKIQIPKFKSQLEMQESKQKEEDKKLNAFINEMQQKYSQYLMKSQITNEKQKLEKELYNHQFNKYLLKKEKVKQNEKALNQKELKEFNIAHTFQGWKKIKDREQHQPLLPTEQALNEIDQYEQNLLEQLLQQEEQEKIVHAHEQILFKILMEKKKLENETYKRYSQQILDQIWGDLDQDKCGYISRSELLNYLTKYQILMDVFDLHQDRFKQNLLSLHTKRKDLLNVKEYSKIMQFKKCKKTQEEILKDLDDKSPSQLLSIPAVFKENQQSEELKVNNENDQPQFHDLDPDINYDQLQKLNEINHNYINKNYEAPQKINIPERKIEVILKPQSKKQLSKDYLKFANEIKNIQNLYNKEQLPVQNDQFLNKLQNNKQNYQDEVNVIVKEKIIQ